MLKKMNSKSHERVLRKPKSEQAATIISNYPNQIGIIKTTCVATMLDAGHAENALHRVRMQILTVACFQEQKSVTNQIKRNHL